MLNDQLKDFSIIAHQAEGKKKFKLKKPKFWAINYRKARLMDRDKNLNLESA